MGRIFNFMRATFLILILPFIESEVEEYFYYGDVMDLGQH